MDALEQGLRRLEPNDYVCFNIGNSQLKLFNDKQANLEPWQSVIEKLGFLREVFDVKTDVEEYQPTESRHLDIVG